MMYTFSLKLLISLCCVALLSPLTVHAATVTFLTSGTSYTTPADWNNSDNSIECIGAGGNGGTSVSLGGGGGGGGGAYAKITNLTISGSVSYVIGTGGSQNDTYFNGAASTTASLSCSPGRNGSGATNGAAGLATNSTGSTKFDGGAGVSGGGGGAGGTTSSGSPGSGSGGNGGTVSGGTGGTQVLDPGAAGEVGGDGTVWQVSPARGAGGGGAVGGPSEVDGLDCLINPGPGGNGGAYGGGAGGGGSKSQNCVGASGGTGAQAIIVTTYTPQIIKMRLKIMGARINISGGRLKILSN